jgi:hypothetical protein
MNGRIIRIKLCLLHVLSLFRIMIINKCHNKKLHCSSKSKKNTTFTKKFTSRLTYEIDKKVLFTNEKNITFTIKKKRYKNIQQTVQMTRRIDEETGFKEKQGICFT